MKRQKVILIAGVLLLLGFVALIIVLVGKNSTQDDTGPEAQQTDYYQQRKDQTSDTRKQIESGELVYSEDNRESVLLALAIYQDEDNTELILKTANLIPDDSPEMDVVIKYRALLQTTRITMRFDEYEQYRATYLAYISAGNEEFEKLESFDTRYPSRQEVEKQFEQEVSEEES